MTERDRVGDPPEERVPWRALLWDAFQVVVGGSRQKQQVIRRHLHPPARVLEIGCATGNLADCFTAGFDYTGVDVDRDAIALAQRRFRGRGHRFHAIDVLETELPGPAAFDYVLVSHTVHHLSDERVARLIRRSCALLRAGGELVILDMLRPAPHEPFGKQFYYRLDRGRHVRDRAELEALFAAAPGFEAPRVEVVETRKLGIEVIDQVVLAARKAGV